MDDSLLLTILQEQTKVATRTEQKVDDMNKRLFGNGQPGVIQIIAKNTESTQEELERVKKEHKDELQGVKDTIGTMESSRKLDRRWLAGVGAILAAEITGIAFYFRYVYTIFHTLFK